MYNLVKNAKILHFLFYNNKNSYVFEYFSSLLSIFLACAIKIFSQKNPHQHLRQRVWNVPKFYFFRFPAYFGIGKMRDREGINICEMETNIMQKTGCQKWLKNFCQTCHYLKPPHHLVKKNTLEGRLISKHIEKLLFNCISFSKKL